MALGDQPDLSTLEPVAAAPRLSGPPAEPAYPPAPNPFQRSPLPPMMVTQPDTLRAFYRGSGAPQTRNIPQPPSATPAIGATASSQAIKVVQEGQGTLLETNNVANADQTTLNLVAGSNISLAANAHGAVTITGTGGGGDGITHGETPWESDPAFVILRDDFISAANNAATSPIISELPWSYANSGGSGYPAMISGGFPCVGSIGWMNSSTAAGISCMTCLNGASSYPQAFAMPVFDYPSWKTTWVFQLEKTLVANDAAWSWSQVSFYIGLGNWCPNSSLSTSMVPRLPCFCGLRYDTDTTAPSIGDTQFVFECVQQVLSNSTPTRSTSNAQGNTSATGIHAVEGHIYRFEMLYTAVGSVQMTLVDGTAGTSYSATLTMPKWTLSNSHTSETQDTGSGIVGFNFANSGGSNMAAPFGPGSQIAVSGITTSGYTGLNGTWSCVGGSNNGTASSIANSILYGSALPASGTTLTGSTFSGYSGVVPWFAFGNDSSASPVAASKGVKVDFFSFVWNPGLNTASPGTPNALKPRYW